MNKQLFQATSPQNILSPISFRHEGKSKSFRRVRPSITTKLARFKFSNNSMMTPGTQRVSERIVTKTNERNRGSFYNKGIDVNIDPFDISELRCKMSIQEIEQEFIKLKEVHNSFITEHNNEDVEYLKRVNTQIRKALKEFNKLINELLELRKDKIVKENNVKKGDSILNQLQKTKAILTNIKAEYKAINKRLNQVTDTEYLNILKERSISFNLQIKKLRNYKRSLEVEQAKREDILDKEIYVGELNLEQEIIKLKNEEVAVIAKLKDADAILIKRRTKIDNLSERQRELNDTWKKLVAHSNMNTSNSDTGSTFKSQYTALLKTKELLIAESNIMKARYALVTNNYTKKNSELQIQVKTILAALKIKGK